MVLLTRSGILISTALVFAGAAFAALPAHAQNLVQDGDFEQADPGGVAGSTDGFTAASPFDANWAIGGEVAIDTTNDYVYDGSKSLYLNSGLGADSVSQSLATATGRQYTLSFYAGTDSPTSDTLAVALGGTDSPPPNTPTPDTLTVTFGGTDVNGGPITVPMDGFNGPPPGNNGLFTFYSYTVTAMSASSSLSFSTFSDQNNTLELDDISVTPAAVPESSTTVSLGLLLTLGGLTVIAHRRRAAPAA